MLSQEAKILIISIIVVGLLIVILKNPKEGYTSNSLTGINPLKRTPVTYAFLGDGISENPHFLAQKSNKLVPLEYGLVDFWKDESLPPPLHRKDAVSLVNDGKYRLDLVESGDIGMHRYFNNIEHSTHPDPTGRPYDVDAAYADCNEEPLYYPPYHYDQLLGN
jgi:hypothetical protein